MAGALCWSPCFHVIYHAMPKTFNRHMQALLATLNSTSFIMASHP